MPLDTYEEAFDEQENILVKRDTTAAESLSETDDDDDILKDFCKTDSEDFNGFAENLIAEKIASHINKGVSSDGVVGIELINENDCNGKNLANNEEFSDTAPDYLAESNTAQQINVTVATENTNTDFLNMDPSQTIKPVVIGNVIHNGNGLSIDDKITYILSNQNTILNVIGQIFVNQENFQIDLTNIKLLLEVMGNSKNNPEAELSLFSGFPLKSEDDLVQFNEKLADSKYKLTMASALRFSVGNTKGTAQQNVNYIMTKLFCDELLCNYSTFGLRGKKSFTNYTAIGELVWQSLKLILKSKEQFDDSVQGVLIKMGKHMKHAPARVTTANRKVTKASDINTEKE